MLITFFLYASAALGFLSLCLYSLGLPCMAAKYRYGPYSSSRTALRRGAKGHVHVLVSKYSMLVSEQCAERSGINWALVLHTVA